MSDSTLSTVGTIGLLALLIIGAIRRRQYSELLIPLLFFVGIADTWFVAPLTLKQHGWSTLWLWPLALAPYAQLIRWLVQSLRTPKALRPPESQQGP
jgi:hypothetical protein